MSTSIERQLNETRRDALVAYFLDDVVKKSEHFKALSLPAPLQDANDLYRFLLLDVQVSQDVQSSPVASAISSLQQYVNAILLGMEPGYEIETLAPHLMTQWREQQSQYPIWAANQQLAWYPEIYIDPTLRLKKTAYFRQLENDINQNKIGIDTVQKAVKTYLTNFERVANLSIVNGYVTSDDFANGTYYFIGKGRGETAYYWRSVDMSQRSYSAGASGPKLDNPQPGAWTDWTPANLPISETALEHTLRPVYFNNRLFVTWLEYFAGDSSALSVTPNSQDTPTVNSQSTVRMVMVYKKYDDSWSAPNVVLSWDTDVAPESLRTITVQDSATSLFLAMYAGYKEGSDTGGGADTYALLKTARMDRNFNVQGLFPANGTVPDSKDQTPLKKAHVMKVGRLFALTNSERLQFKMPPLEISLKSVETISPHSSDSEWNCAALQTSIADMSKQEVIYNPKDSNLELHSKIVRFPERPTVTITVKTTYTDTSGVLTWIFVIDGSESQSAKATLLPGSTLTASIDKWRPIENSERLALDISVYTTGLGKSVTFGPDSYSPITLPGKGKGPYSLAGNMVDIKELNLAASLGRQYQTRVYSYVDMGIGSRAAISMVSTDRPRYYQHHIARPKTIPSKSDVWSQSYSSENVRLINSPYASSLTPPDTLITKVSINEETLRPDWSVQWTDDKDGPFIPLMHGITVQEDNKVIGNGVKGVFVELQLLPTTSKKLIAPRVNARQSETLGTAEFIDFSGSDIDKSDGSTTKDRAPLRMNTLFARELTQKVDVALEYLLSWETQHLPEPPMSDVSDGKPDVMDFHGANGLYFWELFLHLPFLIGQRLNLEHDFTQAERWYNFIFDPARKANRETGQPAFWNVRPLVDDTTRPGYAAMNATDPDGIASSHPVRYQKAVYRHYVQNLVDQGDAAYRQLTPDALGEAKLQYVRVLELLGKRPDVNLIDHWKPLTLERLSSEVSDALRGFEKQLAVQDQQRLDSQKANGGVSTYRFKQPPLRLRTFSQDPTLSEIDSPHLRLPINFKLVALWDTLDSRLRNLRSNRSLDGKPLSLPLFAAPLDPKALLARVGQNAAGGKANGALAMATPHYRFSVMLSRAHAAVDTLMQFGQTLLSLIERKEQAELLELQHQHAWDFAQFAIDLQTQTLKADQQNRMALLASRKIVEARLNFYSERSEENVSSGEIAAGAERLAGRNAENVAAVANIAGCALKVAPNTYGLIAGMANGVITGGFRLEGVAEMASATASGIAAHHHGVSEALDRVEQYRRRHQEWMLARDQAELEIAQIDAHLELLDEQHQITEIQLRQAQTALEQAKATHAFLGKRFTHSQLYQWLNGQFASFYHQMYDTTLSLCLAAEACWQYELADFTTRFIQTTAWHTAHRGLTAGESLKCNLMKMESAYLTRNERSLEITKTVSLRQLAAKEPASMLNQGWEALHAMLQEKGTLDFELTQALFDNDYPDHYCRRIKRISVSLPVTLGPYEDIRATLTQTYNNVELGADNVRENLRASQQIALSSGIDDDGMFTLNFDDERYLPFEGTGVVSRWSLQFPNHEHQQSAIASLTDIIVHVQYTAKSGKGA